MLTSFATSAECPLEKIKSTEAQALRIWEELTGLKIDDSSIRFSLSDSTLNVREASKRLNSALELDGTGISTLIMLRHLYNQYIDSKTVSFKKFLSEPEAVRSELDLALSLNAILHGEVIDPYLDGFVESMKEAFHHYGLTHFDADDINLFDSAVGYLRLDALLGMSKLRKFAFLDSQEVVPANEAKYSTHILKFWNINSLIKLSPMLENGITLCLIQSPDISDSYFCFAVKNGGNLSIITDKENWDHPMQSSMKRNSRREFERMGRFWFPYNLLDIAYDESSKMIYKNKAQTDLIAYQTELTTLGTLSDLQIEEASWLIMMFDLIKERYFQRSVKESLTYTGAMVISEESLLEEASYLPIKYDSSIVMPKITVKDILRSSIEETEPEWKKLKFYNGWLEERYAHKVNDSHLVHLATGASDHRLVVLRDKASGCVEVRDEANLRTTPLERGMSHYQLSPISPTEFGTREEMIKDARWTARYNLAMNIQLLVDEEFKAEERNVMAWYLNAVRSNVPVLLKELVAFNDDYFEGVSKTDPERFGGLGRTKKVYRDEHTRNYLPAYFGNRSVCATDIDYTVRYPGWNSESYATLFFLVEVHNANDICKLTGLSLEELPIFLQHYRMKGYVGNSILDRLDPVDEHIRLPWDKLGLDLIVPLTKRDFNRMRKEAGLHPIKDYSTDFKGKR